MFRDSHHPVIAARASLRAGSKVGLSGPLALLLSSLILVAAMARAEATPTLQKLNKCDKSMSYEDTKFYKEWCDSQDEKQLDAIINKTDTRTTGYITEPRE